MTITVTEAKRIMSDPTHQKFELYRRGDPATIALVNEAFQNIYGSYEVEIQKLTGGEK